MRRARKQREVMAANPCIFRKSSFVPMPDGTLYAELLPPPSDAFNTFGAGVLEVPAGTVTWAHNHQEAEYFVVVAGEAYLKWNGGEERLHVGDAVLMPPLVRHSFSSVNARVPLVLFHWYALDCQWAERQATLLASELDQQHPSTVVVTVSSEGGSKSIADVAERWLRQRGVDVVQVCIDDACHSSDAVLENLCGILEATSIGLVLDLERYRERLVRAIDRASLTANLRRVLMTALKGRLPRVIGIDLLRAAAAVAECAGRFSSDRSLLVIFPSSQVLVFGMAFPVLLQVLGASPPAVIHMTEPGENAAPTAAALRQWRRWLFGVLQRVRRWGGGSIPVAGRWTDAQLSAWDDLKMIVVRASRALAPSDLDVGRCIDLLGSMVARAKSLARDFPPANSCESFEAEGRTTLAIELAVAAQLAILLKPLDPALSRELELSVRRLGSVGPVRAGSLELLPSAPPNEIRN